MTNERSESGSVERIVEAASRLRACVEKQRALRGRVDWGRCEIGGIGPADDPPCPFNPEFDGREAAARCFPERWCQPCRDNWELRDQWKRERQRQSGILRGLVFATAKYEERT